MLGASWEGISDGNIISVCPDGDDDTWIDILQELLFYIGYMMGGSPRSISMYCVSFYIIPWPCESAMLYIHFFFSAIHCCADIVA